MLSLGEYPESLVSAFAKEETFITLDEFLKMCSVEFGLKEEFAKKLFEVLVRCPGQNAKPNSIDTQLLLSLMKFDRKAVKNPVRPIL